MGHDSFYVYENGQKNLAVYNPSQVKSATGNRGTFDPQSHKITEARGGEVSYPLAKEGKDKLTYMKPKKFLAKARSLNMDKDDRTTIDEFKSAIKKGKSLDPLALYPHNRENGRHRAMAAKELGIKKVPVHNYRNEARGGSIVDKALMLTSRRLAAAKAPK